MPDAPLAGLTVAVTRPVRQAKTTVDALRAAGASVIEFPVLDIEPLAAPSLPESRQFHAAIFVSANAVEHGAAAVRDAVATSPSLHVCAIGRATAQALHDAGFKNVVSPQQTIDSEGLLAMPALQRAAVTGQHVLLMRGQSASGGRKLIEETLIARGAAVHLVECYALRAAQPSVEQRRELREALQTKQGLVVMALSVESLDNLLAAFADDAEAAELLRSAWLLVPHRRVAVAAKDRGFGQLHEVPMSTPALVAALIALKPRIAA